MASWIDRLTIAEASAILEEPGRTRYPARNERGEKVTRYVKPTKADLERIRERVDETSG